MSDPFLRIITPDLSNTELNFAQSATFVTASKITAVPSMSYNSRWQPRTAGNCFVVDYACVLYRNTHHWL